MNLTRLMPWACLALSMILASACAAEMGGNEWMERSLDEADQELDRHHGAVTNASSLAEVGDEANRHDANMEGIMADMDDAMGTTTHCSGPATDEMHSMMSGMESEMHDHSTALHASGDLVSARALCASHVMEMHDMISSGHAALGRMSCGMMTR